MQHDFGRGRFGNVAQRAGTDHLAHVLLRFGGRQHHQRDAGKAAAILRDALDADEAGHVEVDQREVEVGVQRRLGEQARVVVRVENDGARCELRDHVAHALADQWMVVRQQRLEGHTRW